MKALAGHPHNLLVCFKDGVNFLLAVYSHRFELNSLCSLSFIFGHLRAEDSRSLTVYDYMLLSLAPNFLNATYKGTPNLCVANGKELHHSSIYNVFHVISAFCLAAESCGRG